MQRGTVIPATESTHGLTLRQDDDGLELLEYHHSDEGGSKHLISLTAEQAEQLRRFLNDWHNSDERLYGLRGHRI